MCVCDTWPAHLKNGSSVNSENFDAADWQNATVKGYTRRCNTIKNIREVIGNNHLKQLYGFSLSNQQSKNNWVLIFIPIFPGEMSEFFSFFLLSLFGVHPTPFPGIPNVKQKVTQSMVVCCSYVCVYNQCIRIYSYITVHNPSNLFACVRLA